MDATQHSIAAFQARAIELIENLARQRDGLNEGKDWQQYVELCKSAGHLPNMDLRSEGKP